MNIQNLNTPSYVIDLTAVSASVTFDAAVPDDITAIIYNDSDEAAFVVSGDGVAAPVAVFPTSANDPKTGKVIGPKTTTSFSLTKGTKHCAAIQGTAGTVGLNLHISFGSGG